MIALKVTLKIVVGIVVGLEVLFGLFYLLTIGDHTVPDTVAQNPSIPYVPGEPAGQCAGGERVSELISQMRTVGRAAATNERSHK